MGQARGQDFRGTEKHENLQACLRLVIAAKDRLTVNTRVWNYLDEKEEQIYFTFELIGAIAFCEKRGLAHFLKQARADFDNEYEDLMRDEIIKGLQEHRKISSKEIENAEKGGVHLF